jgi:hypothetical protein
MIKLSYIRMPVQLPQASGIKADKSGCDGLGDREICRVNLVKLATPTRNVFTWELERVVNERAVPGQSSAGPRSDVARADRPRSRCKGQLPGGC